MKPARTEHARGRGLAVAAAALLAATACGAPDLEVKGELRRVIGETVNLELTQGDPGFSDSLELTDAARRKFAKAQLRSVADGERKLSFVVPRGAAVGAATLAVGKAGESGTYDVAIQVSRLAVTIDDQAKIEALPLPGSSVTKAETQAGTAGKLVSLSPGGGLLVAAVDDDVKIYSLGREIKTAGAGLSVTNVSAVAATDTGAVIGTDASVLVLSSKLGVGITQDASFVVKQVRAVAVNAAGTHAVALSFCDTDNDGTADADCVTPITLDGTNSKLGAEITVDNAPSATHVGIATVDNGGATRLLIVVADRAAIHGIVVDSTATPITSTIPWPAAAPNATPVGLDVGTSSLGPLFAIADSDNSRVQTVGFDGTTLKPVSTATVPAAPAALSYGRGARLYVAAGNKLYFADVGASNEPRLEDIGLTTTNPIKSIAVQK